jgi:hypothetical protein
MSVTLLRWILAFFLVAPLTIVSGEIKPETSGFEGESAFRELATFYGNPEQEPDFAAALRDLTSEDAGKRDAAGRFLLALFRQSFADESNGRSVWQQQPVWGGRSESGARNFRKKLAIEFGEKARGEAALDTVLWLIETEKMPEGQAAAAKVLPRIESPRMEKVIAGLLEQPHPNAALAVAAIEESTRRKLITTAPRVRELRGYYRSTVRNAAREAFPEDAPPFNAANAFTPWLETQLAAIREMLPGEIAKDTQWLDIQSKQYTGKGKETRWVTQQGGWLLSETKDDLKLLTAYGKFERVWKEGTNRIPKKLAEVAHEIAALQSSKQEEDRLKLSERGGLTAQFEGGAISTPAGVLGAVCLALGERAAAAELIFPNIDAMPDDRWLQGILRDRLGNTSHQRMLELFSYERDYPAALKLAEHLSKPVFDGYAYQPRAKELAAQLRKRSDDFKTFKLPTSDEWTKLRQSLSRDEQVKFLAERLRLLNCIQHGQPGDVDYGDPQFAEPGGDPEDAKTKRVINPFIELRKMKLNVADLIVLAPSLADENYMLAFSYWRDFHPSRTLHRVNELVAEIVNDIAKRELAELEKFSGLDEVGQKKHIEAILDWCRANAGKSRADLLLDTIARDKKWREVELAAMEAIRSRVPGAGSVLIERVPDFPDEHAVIAELIYASKVRTAVEAAREWVKSGDNVLRFWGALILLRDGDKQQNEGFADLREVFAQDDKAFLHERAVGPLLERKDEASLALACLILKHGGASGDLLLHLIMTGRQEVLDYLLEGLADETVESTVKNEDKLLASYVRGDRFAEEITALRSDKWNYDRQASDKVRAGKRKELLRWLPQLFAKIRAGKPAPLRKPDALNPTSLRDNPQ